MFQKLLGEFYVEPNKMWVDKALQKVSDSFELYSMHIKEKSVFAERFTRSSKNRICRYTTTISKTLYMHDNKLDDSLINTIINIEEQSK